MGSSAHGELIYGYELGGYDGWSINQTGEFGELEVDWFRDDEDADHNDFVEACQRRLLASAGAHVSADPDEYVDLEELVKEQFGVQFYWHGNATYSASNCALGTYQAHAYGYETKILDLVDLVVKPEMDGWDQRLALVIEILGITPKQPKPAWILTSSYG